MSSKPIRSRKNTSDIALALDALEDLFDHRADTYCLVPSDSDFAYLCRKQRERGAMVCIVGEEKTPDASKVVKRRPKALISAVALMAAENDNRWVGLGVLGQYMLRTDPGFSPPKNGHADCSQGKNIP